MTTNDIDPTVINMHLNDTEQRNGEENTNNDQNEDIVTPWDVSSSNATGIDYDKLIGSFYSIAILR